MKLSKFNFKVPHKSIAHYPPKNRVDAKLMVADRASGTISHHTFTDFPSFFSQGDALVLNDSKIFACFLSGVKEKTKAKIDVLLLRELDAVNHVWDAWIEPARKIRVGNKLCFGEELVAEVIDNTTSRGRTLRFSFDGDSASLKELFDQMGSTPIPHDLKRDPEPLDRVRYQTVYAKNTGGVVAPSAGFHFSRYMLKCLELQGVEMPTITLHIGLDTLRPLEAEDLGKYRVHAEEYHIPEPSAQIINKAKAANKRICAVGCSVLKALESSLSSEKDVQHNAGFSNLLIYPPYKSSIATALLTNFHLPRSISFVNTLAFAGHEFAMEIYETAIDNKYSFFVYGDALLIL